jgi:LemA protein
MRTSTLIIVGLLAVLLMGGCATGCAVVGKRNQIVALNEEVSGKWGQVQNVYQRRFDLIPNLVQTVQGAANFEKETIVAVAEARASVGRVNVNASDVIQNADQLMEFQKAQTGLSAALSRLMIVAEKYPDLKANQNFIALQAELAGTENRIAVERMNFNKAAQDYNIVIQQWPLGALTANLSGFKVRPYFQTEAGAEKAPGVKFDFNKRG